MSFDDLAEKHGKRIILVLIFLLVLEAIIMTVVYVGSQGGVANEERDQERGIVYDPSATMDTVYVEESETASEMETPAEDSTEEESLVQTYSYSGPVLTKAGGVNYYNGRRETWYSQRVLPGGGLDIPGRHVDERGIICDVDGYICVAASDLQYGSIVGTSLGLGKVYDSGCAAGTTDIYTNW